jgi:hypothetical protein
MVESRKTSRHRVLKAGTIEFGGGAIDCLVRNLSPTGAALEVSNQIGIPEKFILVVPGDCISLAISRGAKRTVSASRSDRLRPPVPVRVRRSSQTTPGPDSLTPLETCDDSSSRRRRFEKANRSLVLVILAAARQLTMSPITLCRSLDFVHTFHLQSRMSEFVNSRTEDPFAFSITIVSLVRKIAHAP